MGDISDMTRAARIVDRIIDNALPLSSHPVPLGPQYLGRRDIIGVQHTNITSHPLSVYPMVHMKVHGAGARHSA